MVTKEAIDNAIKAHSRWKTRLMDMINGKDPDFDIARAGTDNNCEFGKWIYGDALDDNDKKTEYYIKVKALHAEFHLAVKAVAEMIVSGKTSEALKIITDFQGAYSQISTKLILLLAEWEKAAGAK